MELATYENVTIIANKGTINQLMKQVNPEKETSYVDSRSATSKNEGTIMKLVVVVKN
jgi:hypothetical protein